MEARIMTSLKFLNNEIEISVSDRHDITLMIYIGFIEFVEEKFGQGKEYLEKMKNNYSLKLDDDLENQIMNILNKKHNG